MYLYFAQTKKCRSNALCIYTFYASKHRKKSNLLPIQAREGLGVISGGIFCLQVDVPITGGLISGGGMGRAFNGGSLRYMNNRETTRTFSTSTYFIDRKCLNKCSL